MKLKHLLVVLLLLLFLVGCTISDDADTTSPNWGDTGTATETETANTGGSTNPSDILDKSVWDLTSEEDWILLIARRADEDYDFSDDISSQYTKDECINDEKKSKFTELVTSICPDIKEISDGIDRTFSIGFHPGRHTCYFYIRPRGTEERPGIHGYMLLNIYKSTPKETKSKFNAVFVTEKIRFIENFNLKSDGTIGSRNLVLPGATPLDEPKRVYGVGDEAMIYQGWYTKYPPKINGKYTPISKDNPVSEDYIYASIARKGAYFVEVSQNHDEQVFHPCLNNKENLIRLVNGVFENLLE